MYPLISTLRSITESKGLDALILSAPDNIEYFTGIPSINDTPVLLVYHRRHDSTSLYVPLLEYQRYRDSVSQQVDVYAVSKTFKPPGIPVIDLDWGEIASKYKDLERVGGDTSHASSLRDTLKAVLGERLIDVSNDVWRVRMVKSDKEISLIEEATKITLKGILAIYSEMHDSVTESALAGVFEKTVREHGIEKLAFDPIVAFKPNNSYPHALPGRRALGKKDLVLIDVGVKAGGRCSDVTRLIVWGKFARDERKSVEAVVEALETAVDAIEPGIKAGEVYEVAARVLDKYGLLNNFIHGLGHGIGVSVHEPPYLRPHSDISLEPGMVFTVEPGVYFAGRYGVRVEDVVVVTKKGVRILSKKLSGVLRSL